MGTVAAEFLVPLPDNPQILNRVLVPGALLKPYEDIGRKQGTRWGLVVV